ncbi:unnamed protein product [Fraxinus pennsylvanica]|uniref:Uncharacterized protein n=1 Tax=Fraxinus pennsylvanica TaxID=56036 RepID=A0AAD2A593_9LAMI|nr:unnamed protein product [Fraxinus pennsylvanica]
MRPQLRLHIEENIMDQEEQSNNIRREEPDHLHQRIKHRAANVGGLTIPWTHAGKSMDILPTTSSTNRHFVLRITRLPVKYDNELEMIGRKLKKNSVALDIVNFGEEDERKPKKLEAPVVAVNNNDRSHVMHVPPGPSALFDMLIRKFHREFYLGIALFWWENGKFRKRVVVVIMVGGPSKDKWTNKHTQLGEVKNKFQQIQEAYSDQSKRTMPYDPDDEEVEGHTMLRSYKMCFEIGLEDLRFLNGQLNNPSMGGNVLVIFLIAFLGFLFVPNA